MVNVLEIILRMYSVFSEKSTQATLKKTLELQDAQDKLRLLINLLSELASTVVQIKAQKCREAIQAPTRSQHCPGVMSTCTCHSPQPDLRPSRCPSRTTPSRRAAAEDPPRAVAVPPLTGPSGKHERGLDARSPLDLPETAAVNPLEAVAPPPMTCPAGRNHRAGKLDRDSGGHGREREDAD